MPPYGQLVRYRRAIRPVASKFRYYPVARYVNPYSSMKARAAWWAAGKTLNAAEKIGRWGARRFRSRMRARKKARQQIGKPIGQASAKVLQTPTGNIGMTDNTLYITRVEYPSKATSGGDSRANRERDIINLSGIKICMDFTAGSPIDNFAGAYVNMAVVVNREDPNGIVFDQTDFFRDVRDSTTSRNRDFTSVQTAIDFNCLPINPQKYSILRHTRKRVASQTNNAGLSNRWLYMSHWIPIKRQIEFTEGGQASYNIFVLTWVSLASYDSATRVNNCCTKQEHIMCYFRDPRTTC